MVKARVHPDTNVISVYEDGFADNETGKTPTTWPPSMALYRTLYTDLANSRRGEGAWRFNDYCYRLESSFLTDFVFIREGFLFF